MTTGCVFGPRTRTCAFWFHAALGKCRVLCPENGVLAGASEKRDQFFHHFALFCLLLQVERFQNKPKLLAREPLEPLADQGARRPRIPKSRESGASGPSFPGLPKSTLCSTRISSLSALLMNAQSRDRRAPSRSRPRIRVLPSRALRTRAAGQTCAGAHCAGACVGGLRSGRWLLLHVLRGGRSVHRGDRASKCRSFFRHRVFRGGEWRQKPALGFAAGFGPQKKLKLGCRPRVPAASHIIGYGQRVAHAAPRARLPRGRRHIPRSLFTI